ncbi:unnamed protein product [Rangifer tarandus platyrhynchus]|uniref:Uncharacterized protein n=1 Tax=Rangifer tarandus platyrhynchus TaxID=3082113 RepID=A0AC59Y8M9_RANTA
MEPQSLAGNDRRTVCATRTRGRSPRAGGGCCPAGCVSEAPAGDSRDQGTPGPRGWASPSARTSFRPEQGSAVDIQPRVGMTGILPVPAWGPEPYPPRPGSRPQCGAPRSPPSRAVPPLRRLPARFVPLRIPGRGAVTVLSSDGR